MNSSDRALQILRQVFGYSSFRPSQQQIIECLARGDDALVLMPTGGGKSLCYQIPALMRRGVGIVVSPLIALMQDQVLALRQLGVVAGALNSSLSAEEDALLRRQLRNGELELLYVAPERLMTPGFQSLLHQIDIALFAIDEAHCVSHWGHDFRPEYIQLSTLHEQFPRVPRVALTATADEPTRREIVQRLNLEQAHHFVSGFDRPNIRYRVSDDSSNARQRLLRFIQLDYADQAGIVYCLSRRKVEDTAAWLREKGVKALPYHAGMSQQERADNQNRFLREDGIVMVATIAFGMGIDKPDVRFVVHMNLPRSLEAYYQETGRAGRDGEPAEALLFYNLRDVISLRQFVEQSDADEQHKRIETQKLERMLGYCELTSCRRQALLAYFGDELAEPCGNCDTCLNPPETWDGTVAAQKALSCVYHTGQRFGVNYLIDVLLGKDNERIRRFGHHRVSTFGIGNELDQNQWRGLFRQLIAQGYLAVDQEGHGGLRLTEACRPLLRGELSLQLRRQHRETASRATKRGTSYRGARGALWEALRARRQELAREQGVPPYVIFHDATLMAMMEYRPRTLEQMSRISGVGERKLEAYGEAFLQVLAEHEESPATSDSATESLELFRLGFSVEDIARRRGLKPSTIYGHMARWIEQGVIELKDVIALEDELVVRIEELMLEQGGDIRLGPVQEALDGMLDYGILACIRGRLNRRLEN